MFKAIKWRIFLTSVNIPENDRKFLTLQQEYGDSNTSINKLTLEELNVYKEEFLSEKLWPDLIELIAHDFVALEQLRNDLKTKFYICKNFKMNNYNYTIKMFLQFKNKTKKAPEYNILYLSPVKETNTNSSI